MKRRKRTIGKRKTKNSLLAFKILKLPLSFVYSLTGKLTIGLLNQWLMNDCIRSCNIIGTPQNKGLVPHYARMLANKLVSRSFRYVLKIIVASVISTLRSDAPEHIGGKKGVIASKASVKCVQMVTKEQNIKTLFLWNSTI